MRAIFVTIILAVLSLYSWNALAQKTQKTVAQKEKPMPAFSGSLTLGQSQSAINQQDGTFRKSYDLLLLSGYKITDDGKWSLGFRGDASQDLINQEDSDVTQARLSLTRSGFVPLKALKTSLGARLGLPVSRAQRDSYFQSSVGLATFTDFDVSGISKNLVLVYGLVMTKNIHQFEENKAGDINTSYSLSQSLDVKLNLTDKFEIAISGGLIDSWTYQGTKAQIFTHDESLSYSFSQNFSATIGHTHDLSPTQKSDGQSSNIKLFDEAQSLVYGSVTFSI